MRKMYIAQTGEMLADSTHGKANWRKLTAAVEGKKIFSKTKLKKMGL